MSEPKGRAGFHVTHTKPVSERAAIFDEAMRELDPDRVAYWAARNPSIVAADEHLNEAMVNDGAGGFRPCTSTAEPIEYGEKRLRRVKRKLREDKLNPKTGKMTGGTVTTSMIVAHLPKSMCNEIQNYYPRTNDQGKPLRNKKTGEPLMRSRWVARDRDEARRYFEQALEYIAETAIPGGMDAVLGYDIQHSETTPHIQIIADTFAPSEKDPEVLEAAWAKTWGHHRDVVNADGKMIYGPEKLRNYHVGLKDRMIELGYNVEADFDEELHAVGLGKKAYEDSKDRLAEARHDAELVASEFERITREVESANAVLASAHRANQEKSDQIEAERIELDKRKHELEQLASQIELKAQAKARLILAEAETKADKIRRAADEQLTMVDDSVAEVINAARTSYIAATRQRLREQQEILDEQLRKEIERVGQSDVGKWLKTRRPETWSEFETITLLVARPKVESTSLPRAPHASSAAQINDNKYHEILAYHTRMNENGNAVMVFMLREGDTAAFRQQSLYLNTREPKIKTNSIQTTAVISPAQLEQIQRVSGQDAISYGGGQRVYPLRSQVRSGMLILNKLKPTERPLSEDWMGLQVAGQKAAQAADAAYKQMIRMRAKRSHGLIQNKPKSNDYGMDF